MLKHHFSSSLARMGNCPIHVNYDSPRSGVYVKGIVDNVELAQGVVSLRVQDHRTDQPITTRATSVRVAEIVKPRYRQVFLWPEDWTAVTQCKPKACKARLCEECNRWKQLPLIGEGQSTEPSRLRKMTYKELVAAHWIVPSRCYEKKYL